MVSMYASLLMSYCVRYCAPEYFIRIRKFIHFDCSGHIVLVPTGMIDPNTRVKPLQYKR